MNRTIVRGTNTLAYSTRATYCALPTGACAIALPNWVPAENTPNGIQQQTLYAGIGDGAGLAPASGLPTTSPTPEICVTGALAKQVHW